MRLALVHDWLNQIGGAEDVLVDLVSQYPNAPIYTSLYNPDAMPDFYREWPIRTLWSDRLPGIRTHHQPYLPVYPLVWGRLDLSSYDVILSNKSGFCHGLQSGEALHVCYCLAPTRYVWNLDAYIEREGLGRAVQTALRPLTTRMQRWDYAAAQRVDHFIAISSEIRDRIWTYYDRASDIIFPPVDTTRFQPVAPDQVEDYYLVVSRLIPYKRIDLAVQAATELGLPLKVGGKGRDLERLQSMAGPTVEFLGFVPDDDLPGLMARAKAFLFPGLEDFGITPVQAQAAGRPVIAYGAGGALDTVIPGITGQHFAALTVESLIDVLQSFDAANYDPHMIREHALQFDRERFLQRIDAYLRDAYAAHQSGEPFIWNDPLRA